MWSEKVAVVHLGDDPQFTDDLATLAALPKPVSDVVLDFGAVRSVNSQSISKLISVREKLGESGARLVLCGISTAVWGMFLLAGVDGLFQFSESVAAALASLQIS